MKEKLERTVADFEADALKNGWIPAPGAKVPEDYVNAGLESMTDAFQWQKHLISPLLKFTSPEGLEIGLVGVSDDGVKYWSGCVKAEKLRIEFRKKDFVEKHGKETTEKAVAKGVEETKAVLRGWLDSLEAGKGGCCVDYVEIDGIPGVQISWDSTSLRTVNLAKP
jgi:hypothetical protein